MSQIQVAAVSKAFHSTTAPPRQGLDAEHSGSVSIQGRPIQEQLGAGFRVAYVFQESRLLPWYTVQQNLEFVLRAGDFARAEWGERIDRVLSAVGLSEFRDFYPRQ